MAWISSAKTVMMDNTCHDILSKEWDVLRTGQLMLECKAVAVSVAEFQKVVIEGCCAEELPRYLPTVGTYLPIVGIASGPV